MRHSDKLPKLIEKAIRNGATQASLAEAIGVSQGHICKLLNGTSAASSKAGRALHEYLSESSAGKGEIATRLAVKSLVNDTGVDYRAAVRLINELARVIKSAQKVGDDSKIRIRRPPR